MIKQEIQRLINGSMFASLGYTDSEGKPSIRKVFCTWHKGLGRHLISTNLSSGHVKALQRNNSSCLYFDGVCNFRGVVNLFEAVCERKVHILKSPLHNGEDKYQTSKIALAEIIGDMV